MKIQSAPSGYAPGSAEGWHLNETVWYQTFELDPEKKVTVTEQPAPQQPTNTDYYISGCILKDDPQPDGDMYSATWVMGVRTIDNKSYNITEPIRARIKIYQFGPTKVLPGVQILGGDLPPDPIPKQLVVDEEMVFTKENPAWVRKISFPAPTQEGGYGLFVTHQNIVKDDYWNGVSCGVSDGLPVSRFASCMSSDDADAGFLPWDYITAKYGIYPR
ncbi:hypothetical protein Dtox_3409 [Desulfofarcimen acetoxidans DSM 771]|uniref:Uncharacterized protein n=1 Tax=Desulfofarcimen acetoxidans (strain ATCC 49208 / DSM 771 / KCTC 5769 / VKM B-1644 / 5575) TaxID=485916 RepID=C8W6M4_DESAS|nr:hypothetical protein [Desulfofarcimen acetoxidans]ACV64133.1 hypothetical protein Dtox_3409 [Desulfofarcimen acetoxidans DSM 771]